MKKDQFISAKESTLLQGIAVLFMVYHHLFGFPDRIEEPFTIVSDFSFFHIGTMISYFGRICISIFAFVSGYGMYKKLDSIYGKKGNFKEIIKVIFKQLRKFLIRYWCVFLVFVPLGFALGVYNFDVLNFLYGFIGLSCEYNAEWWYVASYLKFLVVLPIIFLIDKTAEKHLPSIFVDLVYLFIFAVITIFLLYGNWVSATPLFFFSGIACVSTGLFDRLWSFIGKFIKKKYLFCFILLIIMCIVRMFLNDGCTFDYLYTPFIIFFLCIILKSDICRNFNKILLFVGKYSTYIWLLHTFFAYYYFQEFLYWSEYSTIIFIVCVLCCITIGIIYEFLIAKGEALLKRFRKGKSKG